MKLSWLWPNINAGFWKYGNFTLAIVIALKRWMLQPCHNSNNFKLGNNSHIDLYKMLCNIFFSILIVDLLSYLFFVIFAYIYIYKLAIDELVLHIIIWLGIILPWMFLSQFHYGLQIFLFCLVLSGTGSFI